MKKLLSAVLVVCIFFSFGIVSAYAETEYKVTDAAGLEDAIKNASGNDIIVLDASINLDRNITVDKALSIKANGNSIILNGYTITVKAILKILEETHIYGSSSNIVVDGSTGKIDYDTDSLFLYDGPLGKITYNPSADPTNSILVEETTNSDGVHVVPIPDLPYFPAKDITSTYKSYGTDVPELTFAMQFHDPVEVSLIQAAYYGSWHADFVVTVNKDAVFGQSANADGYLAGRYQTYSDSWISVPFGSDVPYVRNTNFALMSSMVTPWQVQTIYEYVQKFECGIFFTDEFIANNPDLKVSVELRISRNPSDVANGTIIAQGKFEIKPPVSPVPATDDNSHVVLWAVLLVMFTASAVISGKKRLTKS